ncbi:MAG: hypothetical protein R3B90_05810 [Planctomycetaceae bacterium]
MLWDKDEPIGICVFVSPPLSLSQRNHFFGHSGRWNSTTLKVLNQSLVLLQRVVIHPTYRGAGIAAQFVRRSCELTGVAWVETLSQMGHINPFFEKAGFLRVGTTEVRSRSRQQHSAIYGGRRRHAQKTRLISRETYEKSRHANPVYYIFDNRGNLRKEVADPLVLASLNEAADHEVRNDETAT